MLSHSVPDTLSLQSVVVQSLNSRTSSPSSISPTAIKRQSPPSPTYPLSPDENSGGSMSSRPTKRSRKAINCEPCRASKLKCDRGRPCSGCVLRGTISMCYADSTGRPDDVVTSSNDERRYNPRIDARAEITRIRNSLLVIEAQINRTSGLPPHGNTTAASASVPFNALPESRRNSSATLADSPAFAPINAQMLMKLPDDPSPEYETDDGGGSFVGGTSIGCTLKALAHHDRDGFSLNGIADTEKDSGAATLTNGGNSPSPRQSQSPIDDLLRALPDQHEVDKLVAHYFAQCVWTTRPVRREDLGLDCLAQRRTSMHFGATRKETIMLGKIFLVLAVTLAHQMPASSAQSELARQYSACAEFAYNRLPSKASAPCLNILEYRLLQIQYLELQVAFPDSERIWALRNQAIGMALSLGLHRDPGRWGTFNEAEKERRRSAWWNVLWLDRWHAFLLGRPPSIQNRHFDTTFPAWSMASPDLQSATSPSSTTSFVNVYRLAHLLGSILDDLSSAAATIQYDRVWGYDQALQTLLDANEQAGGSGASAATSSEGRVRNLMECAAMLHVRIALHRSVSEISGGGEAVVCARGRSFESAVWSAESLLQLYFNQLGIVTSAAPSLRSRPATPVSAPRGGMPPAYLASLTSHAYSAAIYLASVLIAPPPPPCVAPPAIRQTLKTAVRAFATLKSCAVAERSRRILGAMQPLWEEEGTLDERRRLKIWEAVKKLGGLGSGMSGSYFLLDAALPTITPTYAQGGLVSSPPATELSGSSISSFTRFDSAGGMMRGSLTNSPVVSLGSNLPTGTLNSPGEAPQSRPSTTSDSSHHLSLFDPCISSIFDTNLARDSRSTPPSKSMASDSGVEGSASFGSTGRNAEELFNIASYASEGVDNLWPESLALFPAGGLAADSPDWDLLSASLGRNVVKSG